MVIPFAEIETALAATCLGALANATATIAGVVIDGVFDAGYRDTLGIANSSPTFRCAAADVADIASNTTVTIAGTAYRLRAKEPDGQGLTVLVLELA